ncbi:MAG: hypothetical protein GF353_29010 [Candidatus Lokiarchaeota archaeon]|nr:hypothetical protein [Candidatus Lokiarchaeota archaeon]
MISSDQREKINMSVQNRKCFVIMPFGKKGTEEYDINTKIYKLLIHPVVESCNYYPVRADELEHLGSITRHIIESLYDSELVIADLSGKNANVFYEMGVRHVLFRYGTIPIIRKGEEIPFDLANYRVIFYSRELDGPEHFKRDLKRRIKAFEKAKHQNSDNPVHDILGNIIGIIGKTAVTYKEFNELKIFNKELKDENRRLNELIEKEKLGGYETELAFYKELTSHLEKQNKVLNNEKHKLIGKNEILESLLQQERL